MKTMHERFDQMGCPTEDSIERWAIQEVMGNGGGERAEHLEYCSTCHELHSRFVKFYTTVNSEVGEMLAPKTGRTGTLLSTEEIRIKPAFKAMRPLDPPGEDGWSRIPIAFSRELLAGHFAGGSGDRIFVSSDGTLYGRFLSLQGGFNWSFQLLSPDPRFVRNVLLAMREEDQFFQSDDLGSVELVPWAGSPERVGSLEIIPCADRVVYSIPGSRGQAELPQCVELEGDLAGHIAVEQEEGENAESILHIYLPELPRHCFDRQVIVAFSDSLRRCYIEESVGRDIYLYGPDLFRDFRLWLYIR